MFNKKIEKKNIKPILLYVSWIVMLVNDGPLERMIGVQSLYEEHKWNIFHYLENS